MNKIKVAAGLLLLTVAVGCSGGGDHKKGAYSDSMETDTVNDLRAGKTSIDSLLLGTRPRTVLLTGIPRYRLTPILKVNWDSHHKATFVSEIAYRSTYAEEITGVQVWNSHVAPGFEAACGYNIVNVSHFDTQSQQPRNLFDSLVLVKTLYYPTCKHDTLNGLPVHRDCYLVSVFDEDTNHDGFVNQRDLRRLYHFELPSLTRTTLVPRNYSVVGSEYDPFNDYLYVFAKLDGNQNGQLDDKDDTQIFWVDLANPKRNGKLF